MARKIWSFELSFEFLQVMVGDFFYSKAVSVFVDRASAAEKVGLGSIFSWVESKTFSSLLEVGIHSFPHN